MAKKSTVFKVLIFQKDHFFLIWLLFSIWGCSPFSGQTEIQSKAISLKWDNLSYNFGQVVVGSSDRKVFKITNNSETTLVNCGNIILSDAQNFNIISSTCTNESMSPNESCEVDIETRPLTSGLKTLTLERVCGERFAGRTAENMIQVDARILNMSWDLSAHNFGTQDVFTGSGSQIFTIVNSGDGVASNCSAPTISDSVNFSVSIDTCGTSNLIGSGSCAVTVLSHPRSIGLKQATLARSCTVGGVISTTTDMIQVSGTGPSLAWDQMSYDFGNLEVGLGGAPIYLNLLNTGTEDATGCTPVTIDDNVNFSFSDSCQFDDVLQGGACGIELIPQALSEGPQSVTVSRSCTYGGTVTTTAQEIRFNGVQHLVEFSPNVFDFSTNPAPQVFTFSNPGNHDAQGCAPASLTDDSHFSITVDGCGAADLVIGASCQVTVTPHPASFGVQTAILNRSCGAGQYSASANLSATGTMAVYGGVAALNVGRYLSNTTVLLDGSILAMGGTGVTNNNYLNSVEMYDPNSELWTTKASMNLGRNWVRSIRLQDGKVLVVGGSVGYDTQNQVEIYDPILNTWSVRAPMNVARVCHTLSLLADGKVLAVGGNSYGGQTRNTSLSSVEVYDPVLNTWTVRASLGQNRYFHEAQTLQDGRVLVFGGDSTGGRTSSVEIYNPTLNTWTASTSLNHSRSQFSSVILPDGKVMALGGYGFGALNSIEIYDPILNNWTLRSPMSRTRYYLASTVLQNGNVLVSGGMNDLAESQNSVEIFNPVLNTWTARTVMADRRALHTSALLPNGQVLICGGIFDSTIFATCEKR